MDVNEAIRARRAYRAFEPAEITDKDINDMAEAASLAASCFNNQPWKFIFVRSEEMLKKLFAALNKGNEWAMKSSAVCAVLTKKDFDCVIKERLYYMFDTGMACQNLILNAVSKGLTAHPVAGFSPEAVREALKIPEDFEVVTLINIGKKSNDLSSLSDWQKQQEEKRPDRLPLKNVYSIDYYSEELNVKPARK